MHSNLNSIENEQYFMVSTLRSDDQRMFEPPYDDIVYSSPSEIPTSLLVSPKQVEGPTGKKFDGR